MEPEEVSDDFTRPLYKIQVTSWLGGPQQQVRILEMCWVRLCLRLTPDCSVLCLVLSLFSSPMPSSTCTQVADKLRPGGALFRFLDPWIDGLSLEFRSMRHVGRHVTPASFRNCVPGGR